MKCKAQTIIFKLHSGRQDLAAVIIHDLLTFVVVKLPKKSSRDVRDVIRLFPLYTQSSQYFEKYHKYLQTSISAAYL